MGMRACILDHDGSIRTTTLSPRTSVPHKSFRVFACGCLGMNRDVVGSVRQKSQAAPPGLSFAVLRERWLACSNFPKWKAPTHIGSATPWQPRCWKRAGRQRTFQTFSEALQRSSENIMRNGPVSVRNGFRAWCRMSGMSGLCQTRKSCL